MVEQYEIASHSESELLAFGVIFLLARIYLETNQHVEKQMFTC